MAGDAKRCACGRFEIPGDGMSGQVADGVLHLDASAVPDVCEIARLRAEVAALSARLGEAEGLLRDVEYLRGGRWGRGEDCCPMCGAHEDYEHLVNCRLATFLEAGAQGQGGTR